ncbi:unnamed protein product [Fraxinus pennsylvanica]|uniref:Uncharacterized protein n=1 Tax=Fraxinus pennsylvanica TaxID=56036 RepID=A0AAD1ZY35_9LAMI|nr:unnamed protein product [Fraxinus pennsylvanica]
MSKGDKPVLSSDWDFYLIGCVFSRAWKGHEEDCQGSRLHPLKLACKASLSRKFEENESMSNENDFIDIILSLEKEGCLSGPREAMGDYTVAGYGVPAATCSERVENLKGSNNLERSI